MTLGDGSGSEQTVSWSAALATSVGPIQVGGAVFQIELVRSAKLGQLAMDELVVSTTGYV